MGRWSYSNKTEADNLKKIEIWWLKKFGYLNGWKSGGVEWTSGWSGDKSSIGITVSTMANENYIRFQYSQTEHNGEKKNFDYKARLVSTACNYGGERWWFVCPLTKNGVPCNRRVGVLYKDGDYFGCRHCYELTYQSKNENRSSKYHYLFRLLSSQKKIEKIRENMGREFYAGKPTKKFKKIMKIYEQDQPYYDLLRREKGV